jgi:hypothetical protein
LTYEGRDCTAAFSIRRGAYFHLKSVLWALRAATVRIESLRCIQQLLPRWLTVPRSMPLQARVRPYFLPLNQHFRKKVDTDVQVFGGKSSRDMDWTPATEASFEHYSQEPLEIQQITSVRYTTHRMETTRGPRYHSVRLLTGHSGSGPKNERVQRLAFRSCGLRSCEGTRHRHSGIG